MCGTKKISPFSGDADHVSESHDPEMAGCGGSVQIMGDADICTADMKRVHQRGLGQRNEYLDPVTADQREASVHGLPDIIVVAWAVIAQAIQLYLCLLH